MRPCRLRGVDRGYYHDGNWWYLTCDLCSVVCRLADWTQDLQCPRRKAKFAQKLETILNEVRDEVILEEIDGRR